MIPEPLDIAYRSYQTAMSTTAKRGKRNRSGRGSQTHALPRAVLVLDTETTTDPTQRLNFLAYRFLTLDANGTHYDCAEEGLAYADDLPRRDPRGFEVLRHFVASHEAEVTRADVPTALRLRSQREFLDRVFRRAALQAGAAVVGFNLPFDLSRLALWAAPGRARYRRAIQLTFWGNPTSPRPRASMFRPGISIRALDGKRALMSYTDPRKDDDSDYSRGDLIDLKTLVYALTDRAVSLATACELFDCPHNKTQVARHGVIIADYVEYCRQDVRATTSLFEACVRECLRHPVNLDLGRLLSPAALGKAYLRAMGVRPLLERQPDFPAAVIGYGAAAYSGGRAECRIRRTPVPVVYTDFRSMYPTVASLMGMWDFYTCERVECEDVTEAVNALLARLGPDDLFDPQVWPQLNVLVKIQPEGLVLPVRAHYAAGEPWQVGVNHLHLREGRWYALADVVAGCLASGIRPTVQKAVRLVPTGLSDNLRPVEVASRIPLHPSGGNLFQTLVEERARAAQRADLTAGERERLETSLKTIANSVAYGIQAETLPEDLPIGKRASRQIWSLFETPADVETPYPESLRAFGFMPLAACVTAGARLMLALLEAQVTAAGGSYAMTDTDSMAIVASEAGGLVPVPGGEHLDREGRESVRALNWDQVDQIVQRFTRLNPYSPEAIPGSILKIEKDNFDSDHNRRELWCYAISAKRYCLFTRDREGQPAIVKASEHGLGHLLNPIDPDSDSRDWITAIWEHIVREALGLPTELLAWKDRPAITRLTVSAADTFNLFREYNAGKSYADQIKPFNFMLAAHVAPFGHPEGVDPESFQLVAPYEMDARNWLNMEWLDRYSGQHYRVTTCGHYGTKGVARIRTIGDVVTDYKVRPEHKSAGPDGRPCGRATRGVLSRRHVTAASETLIGKEAHHLEDMQRGVIHDEAEAVSSYIDPRLDPWHLVVLPILQSLNVRDVARIAKLTERQVRRLVRGECYPHRGNRDALVRIAATNARTKLISTGLPVPRGDLACCTAWLALETTRR